MSIASWVALFWLALPAVVFIGCARRCGWVFIEAHLPVLAIYAFAVVAIPVSLLVLTPFLSGSGLVVVAVVSGPVVPLLCVRFDDARIDIQPQEDTYVACPHCSYNLTGNVSGRCPECGTEIVAEDA